MPYNFVQQAEGSVAGSGTTIATGTGGTNFGAGLTAGNLKAFVVFYTAAAAKTISFSDVAGNNDAAHVQVGSFFNATDSQGAVWGWVKNILGGTGTTTATANAAVTFFAIYCAEFSGLDAANPFQGTVAGGNRQVNPGTGANAITSTNITPSVQPAMLFGFCNDFTTATANEPAAGTGFTGRANVWKFGGTTTDTTPEDKRLTSLAAVAATFTGSNGAAATYYTIAMVFSEPIIASGQSAVAPMPYYNTIFINE